MLAGNEFDGKKGDEPFRAGDFDAAREPVAVGDEVEIVGVDGRGIDASAETEDDGARGRNQFLAIRGRRLGDGRERKVREKRDTENGVAEGIHIARVNRTVLIHVSEFGPFLRRDARRDGRQAAGIAVQVVDEADEIENGGQPVIVEVADSDRDGGWQRQREQAGQKDEAQQLSSGGKTR